MQTGEFFYTRQTDGGGTSDEITGIVFLCPCGCSVLHAIGFSWGKPRWEWDGNIEQPTVTPSLGLGVGEDGRDYHWHGYLTKGAFHDYLHDGNLNWLTDDDGRRITAN